jgi:ATP-binding cassette subfamily B protein
MKTRLSTKHIENTFVLQQGQSDCGVACLLSLIQYYKGSSTLEHLRALSGTSKQGTTLLGLYQAANTIGFNANGNEADLQAVIDHNAPVILHVVIGNRLNHYFVCYGYINSTFIIGDPAKGMLLYTKAELEAVWKSKTCLTLVPNEHFKKVQTIKQDKKAWFLNVLKPDYKLLLFSSLLGLGIAALGMAMSIFSQKLIDDILPSKNLTKLITGIVLVAVLLLVRVVFTAIRDYFLIRQSKDFNNRIIDRFYSALLHLPKPFFDTRKIGELTARLNDTQRVQRVISTIASGLVINSLVTLVSLGVLFYYSWQTGVIAILSLPFYYLLIYKFNKPIILAQKEVMQGYAHSESNYISSMQGIATIKNNNKQGVFKTINKLIYGNFQDKAFTLGQIKVRLAVLSGAFNVLFLVGVLTYTALQVYNNTMQLGELMAVLGIASTLLPAVASLALITIPINEAKVAFNRMYEFATIETEPTGVKPITKFENLTITDLAFRFAGRSPLLQNINLTIKENECIAIIGESGCGKSTLGQILQKFYTAEEGTITLNNNITLNEVSTIDWRTVIGVIPQDITIFNGTIIDNILLGAEADAKHVEQFITKYHFKTFISNLPQGYSTILGEEGVSLSGGQKQILALMRALYKQPQLLILDEFTSAMDRKTEAFVLNLLKTLKQELSILFISHRLQSLKYLTDRIYIIENKTIDTFGTHKDLLKTNNFYSDFWKDL